MKRAAALLVGAFFLGSPLARGHGPATLEDTIVTVESPELSWVFVGEFIDADEVFQLDLDYPDEGFALPVEMLIPHQRGLEQHRPMFAVVGPGLPPPTEAVLALLPREVPDGMGVFLEKNDVANRPAIFEAFMRRVYWTSSPVALALDRGHTEIWVWSPHGTTGKFSIGLGVEEDFGADSITDLLAHWSDYAY